MSAPPAHDFAVEVHPPDWKFPATATWLAGWIKPPAGGKVTDVRARLGPRVLLGLSGLTHPAHDGHGFSFLLTPQRDATRLQLDARGEDGQWQEFFATAIAANPSAPTAPARPDLRPAFGELIIALLMRRRHAPHVSWDELADELLAGWVAEPLNAFPNQPFVGALEEPHGTGRFRYGVVPVTGWLAHGTARITQLTAVIDPLAPIALPLAPIRRDVPHLFPKLESHGTSAFAGEVPVPAAFAAPVLLKIYATLENGEQHLAFAHRFTPRHFLTQGEMPPQVPAGIFVRAVRALHRAAGRYGLSCRGLVRTAFNFWRTHRALPAYRPAREFRGASRFHPPATAKNTTHETGPATTLIAPGDDMLVRDAAPYFEIGLEALQLVQAARDLVSGGKVAAILDLPCGHGRVARWFRAAYPDATLVVSDTQVPGVQFCVEHLGAIGVTAHADGRHWPEIPDNFDVIWCGSLLTHLDRAGWETHLRRFAERLSPQGVLVFTAHGQIALHKLQTGEKDYGLPVADTQGLCTDAVTHGFGYRGYPETPDYGISVSQAEWIRELVANVTNLQVLAIHESAWDQHQDVVVCTPRQPRK